MNIMEIEISQPLKELMFALKLNPDPKTIHHLIESGLLLKLTTVINPHSTHLKA